MINKSEIILAKLQMDTTMMKNKLVYLLGLLVLLLVFNGCSKQDYIILQPQITEVRELLSENEKLMEYITNKKLLTYNEIKKYEDISSITRWPLNISGYFYREAHKRNIDVNKALAVINVETGGTYKFDLVNNKNANRTRDVGIFQINDGTYPCIVRSLKKEGYNFASWDRKDPLFGISAGLYWLSYLQNTYKYTGKDALLTSFNRGHGGLQKLISRSGSPVSTYSQKVLSKMQK